MGFYQFMRFINVLNNNNNKKESVPFLLNSPQNTSSVIGKTHNVIDITSDILVRDKLITLLYFRFMHMEK